MTRLLLRVGGVLLVAGWAIGSATRVQEWTDERRLWAAAVREGPSKPRPLINYANTLTHTAPDLAKTYYAEAIRLAEQPGRTGAERTVGVAIATVNAALLRMDTPGGDVTLAVRDIHQATDRYRVAELRQVEAWVDRRVIALGGSVP